MAIKEYTPGTAFPGVIGRTIDESQPAWPRPLRAKPGAPNVLFIVLDDTGFGQLGCYGSPIQTPNLDRLAADGLRYNNMHTTALCSPSRSCMLDRPQPPLERDGVHHRGRDRLPGLERPHPVRERLPVRDAAGARLQHVRDRQVAPDADRAVQRRRARTTAGRSAAASSASTASWAATRSQYYPDLVYDNHQVKPPKTPEQGYHLTEDLVDHAIEFIADAKQVAPDKPFFMYFCTGAMHAPHHVPKEWADKYKGQFDDGWDAYREKVFAAAARAGHPARRARKLSARDPDVADVGHAGRRREAALRAHDGGVRRLPRAHRPPHRPADRRSSRRSGQLDNTLIMVVSDNGASAEGGPHGSVNENLFFNNVPETLEDEPRGDRRARRARSTSTTTRGAGPGPATRRSAAGSARPTAAALAIRSSCTGRKGIKAEGRDPHAVRARHRHGADGARRARHRAAGADPRRHAVTDRGRLVRAHVRRRQGADAPPHAVLRDVRPPRASITTAGARCVRCRDRRSPRRAWASARWSITEEKLRELDAKGWELYHVDRGLLRDARTSRPSTATS